MLMNHRNEKYLLSQRFSTVRKMENKYIKCKYTSRRASAYELMSVMITRTCFSHWYAMNSAVVSAIRGVIIRSILRANTHTLTSN